jgi:hypothetical protein
MTEKNFRRSILEVWSWLHKNYYVETNQAAVSFLVNNIKFQVYVAC